MTAIIFGIVAVIILIAAISVVRAFGNPTTQAGVDAFLQRMQQAATDGVALAVDAWNLLYDAVLYPIARRLTWATMAVVALAAIVATGELVCNWHIFLGPFVLMVGVAAVVALVMVDRLPVPNPAPGAPAPVIPPGRFFRVRTWLFGAEYSVWTAFMVSFSALAIMGGTLFVIGQYVHSYGLAVMGAALLIMANEMLFATAHFIARLGTVSVDLAEGSSNFFIKLASNIASKGKSGAVETVREGINYANQERFIPAVYANKAYVIAALYPVLAIGVLYPSITVATTLLVIGVGSTILLSYLAVFRLNVWARRVSTALLVEKIAKVLIACMLLRVFFPKLWDAFVAFLSAVQDEFLAGKTAFTVVPWQAALLGGALSLVLFLTIKPSTKVEVTTVDGQVVYPRFYRMRQIVAGLFAALALYAAVCLVVTAFTWGTIDTVTASRKNMLSVTKMSEPKVQALGYDSVRIEWTEVRSAVGYKVQRRLVTDTEFETPMEMKDGTIRHFKDTGVTSGKSYAYRVIAVYANSTSESSPEVIVSMPKAPEPASTTTIKPSGNAERRTNRKQPVRLAASSESEDSPGIDRYCQNNPTSPNCPTK